MFNFQLTVWLVFLLSSKDIIRRFEWLQNKTLKRLSVALFDPGSGQIYNKQKPKAIFFSSRNHSLRLFLRNWSWELAIGSTHLTVCGQDNSLYLDSWRPPLDHHCVVYFLFYALNIEDAGTVAKRINNGIAVPKIWKKCSSHLWKWLPYLLIILHTLLWHLRLFSQF